MLQKPRVELFRDSVFLDCKFFLPKVEKGCVCVRYPANANVGDMAVYN